MGDMFRSLRALIVAGVGLAGASVGGEDWAGIG